MRSIFARLIVVSNQLRLTMNQWLLKLVLAGVYFGLVTPYAIICRWLLRRNLYRSRAAWVLVSDSTDTPGLFKRST